MTDGAAAFAVEVAGGAEEALAAVARAAEEWGADWRRETAGGVLALPVLYGLRRGWVRGPLAVGAAAAGGGTRVSFTVEERHERLHGTAIVVLATAAVGALLTVAWPFAPSLLPLAPFGALLALAGWFLVVSRLRTSGPAEFLDHVAHLAREGPPPPDEAPDGAAE